MKLKLKQFLWVGIALLCMLAAHVYGQSPPADKAAKMEATSGVPVPAAANTQDTVVVPAYPDPNLEPVAYMKQLYLWVLALLGVVLTQLTKAIPRLATISKYTTYAALSTVLAIGFYRFGLVNGFTAFFALLVGFGGIHLDDLWSWLLNLFRRRTAL